jgi:hypothetical protein
MKETYEFRLSGAGAALFYWQDRQDLSKPDGPNIVRGEVDDDQYRRIRELDGRLRADKKLAFLGWEIKRTYTLQELEKAELFLLKLRYKHAAGDEFGTWYTESGVNPDCGMGRKQIKIISVNPFQTVLEDTHDPRCALGSRQVGPLQIPFRKLMRGRDIFSLWSGETIVSEKLARLVERGGYSGGNLQEISDSQVMPNPLRHFAQAPSGAELLARAAHTGLKAGDPEFRNWVETGGRLGLLEKALWELKELKDSQRGTEAGHRRFMQLLAESNPLETSERTIFGESPFRETTERCACIAGEIRGNLLSPLSVLRTSWDGADFCQTNLYFGGRMGLFRPHRKLIVSKRLFNALRREGIKGFEFEVVEMV